VTTSEGSILVFLQLIAKLSDKNLILLGRFVAMIAASMKTTRNSSREKLVSLLDSYKDSVLRAMQRIALQ
jgi:hypothetical protein